MSAPTDLNSQIALKKGWTWSEELLNVAHIAKDKVVGWWPKATNWINPEGEPAVRPDFTGTLEGVAGMMRELNERNGILIEDKWRTHWMLYFEERYSPDGGAWIYTLTCALAIDSMWDMPEFICEDIDKLGDCVGEAYVSVFEKKTIAKEVKGVCDKREGSVP